MVYYIQISCHEELLNLLAKHFANINAKLFYSCSAVLCVFYSFRFREAAVLASGYFLIDMYIAL